VYGFSKNTQEQILSTKQVGQSMPRKQDTDTPPPTGLFHAGARRGMQLNGDDLDALHTAPGAKTIPSRAADTLDNDTQANPIPLTILARKEHHVREAEVSHQETKRRNRQ
jgi:hypothetical protein